MFKNVAGQKFIVFAFDSATNLPKSGDAANITAYVGKDFAAATVLADTSATEIDATNAKGYYLFDAAQAESNADVLHVTAKSSTSGIVVIGAPAVIFTQPAYVGGRYDASVGAMAAGVITNAAFDTTAGPIHALGIVDQGTAQSATSTTLRLRAAATFGDTEPVGSSVYIVSATTGAGQLRQISSYAGSTDTATVDAWTTTPTGTIVYMVFAGPPGTAASLAAIADAICDELLSGHAIAGSVGAALSAAGAAADPLATVVPGAYGATTAGYKIGTFLDASVAAVKAKTDSLTFTVAGMADANVTDWKGATAPAMTGDAFARLGAPAGASVSADAAAIKADTAAALLFPTRVVCRFTVSATSPSTTGFTASVMSPSGVDADQFKGRVITFDTNTTTTALRGQTTVIETTSAAALPAFTFAANPLTRAPQSGDTGSIT